MANPWPLAGSTFCALALGAFLVFSGSKTARAVELIEQTFDGLTVLAHGGAAAGLGVGAPSAQYGAQRIREALAILRRRSPENYRAVKALEGHVYIEYDPASRQLAPPNGPLALFRSRTGVNKSDRAGARTFVAVLGARVIQWPVAEIAGIIVHELVGHGRQYDQNRLQAMDNRDRECEARLHQMRAYQDLGVATGGGIMAAFRTSLEDVWCRRFSGYLSESWPEALDPWTSASLDVPHLLVAFNTYRRSGARIRRRGEGTLATGSFDLLPHDQEKKEDPSGPSLRGAKDLIAYARLILLNDE